MSCNLLKYIINNILIRNCIFLKRELYKCIIISKVVFLMVFFEKKNVFGKDGWRNSKWL